MAAGSLITEDWQMEYAGLLLGGSTNYSIATINGLLDLPAVLSSDAQRLKANGMFAGDDFIGGRSITVSVETWGDSDAAFSTLVANLTRATLPGRDEQPLVFQIPGVAGGGKRQIMCRPRRRATPIGKDFYYKIPIFNVEFFATSPFIFENTLNQETVTLAAAGGSGLQFDAVPDLTFGGLPVGGVVVCTNSGDSQSYPVLTIHGPCVNPRIENTESNKTVAFDLTLDTGDELVVDMSERTVVLNGNASRYSALTSTSEFWSLSPGNSTIRFTASTTTAASLDIEWRSAWV